MQCLVARMFSWWTAAPLLQQHSAQLCDALLSSSLGTPRGGRMACVLALGQRLGLGPHRQSLQLKKRMKYNPRLDKHRPVSASRKQGSSDPRTSMPLCCILALAFARHQALAPGPTGGEQRR